MKLYQEIIQKSQPVDVKFEKLKAPQLNEVEIVFHVPTIHPRAKEISSYTYKSLKIENLPQTEVFNLTKNHVFIIDESVSKLKFIQEFIKKQKIELIILKSIEGTVKTKPFLDDLVKKHDLEKKQN